MNFNRIRSFSHNNMLNNNKKKLKIISLNEQDNQLDKLLQSITKQKEIGLLINKELELQKPLISNLHKRTISCNDIIYREQKKLDKYNDENESWFRETIKTLFFPFKLLIITPISFICNLIPTFQQNKTDIYYSRYPRYPEIK
jgi:restriction endonuclease